MASLNEDDLFWLHIHQLNNDLQKRGQQRKMMPNLGFLQKTTPGKYPQLERALHDRIIDFIQALASPTAHPYHWQNRAHYIRFLLNHYEDLHQILITTYQKEPDQNKAFQTAWDTYVLEICSHYEMAILEKIPSNYPACQAEDVCNLCELQWENTPNTMSMRKKCACCEMTASEKLIPELSFFIPLTPNGTQDELHNQHLWSYTSNLSNMQSCLDPNI